MAKESNNPIVTKKHLARVERERLQTRTILIISGIVIALVVILIGWGVVKSYIIEPQQTLVTVDGVEVSSDQFQALAKFSRGQLVEQYIQYYQFMQMFGGDAENQSSFLQTLSQINFQLQPQYLGQNTVDSLIEDLLVRKEAANRGITVSEEEIDKILEEFLGYYPGGTPTPEPTAEILPTSTLSALQMTLIAPTPTIAITSTEEVTSTAVPTTTNPSVTEIITATATAADEADSLPTATTEILPTPTVYTENLYNQNMGNYLEYTRISEKDLRWIFESQLFRQKLFEELTSDIAKEADQVWSRQIVVADEETAKIVVERLEAGEDFAALASELSTDEATKSSGGDLGWLGLGSFDLEVGKILFDLSIGQISDPIQTTAGWYIVQALGHEIRPIPESEYQLLVEQTYQDWLTAARTAAQVDINDLWLERVPTEPSVPLAYQLSQ